MTQSPTTTDVSVDGATPSRATVHLRRSGTSLVLGLPEVDLPCVLHWGADLGPADLDALGLASRPPYVDSEITAPPRVAILPRHSAGWLGRPGLLGSRSGRDWSVRFDQVGHEVTDSGSGVARVRSTAVDTVGALEVSSEVELHPSGLVRVRAAVRNLGDDPYEVQLVQPALPVPTEADELLDMAGRWGHERTPQHRPFGQGTWLRESWGGRPGHDSPTVLAAGEAGFGFRSGRVWGVHLAWSGNQVLSAERSGTGWRLLGGGELVLPGEVRLGRGEEYVSPWLTGSWGQGLDELSGRYHRFLRSRPEHPSGARPVLLNVWEAVYFDHDLPRLLDLAEQAAALGVERFVLDDGWFLGRRDDTRGLGDWVVDPDVWPNGLGPLVDRVHELGMQFGLWFEPEMVNLDSDLARAHPDWVLGTAHGPGPESRQQQVLDLTAPGAYEHIVGRISDLVSEYRIGYLKWDHNRPLVDAGSGPDRTPGVRAQTLAVYRMMAELKARHPGLEIESCAGGGGRVDLGIMAVADWVWVSDCIDAHERHRMVRWTGLTLPPELMGTHVGSGADHTTGRVHSLDFRAGTAIWGHLGIEWDLTRASDADLAALGAWVAFHKEVRDLLHTGTVVRADLPDPALQLDGVVAADRTDALYRLSALEFPLTWPQGRVRLPGLDPDRTYRVTVQVPGDAAARGRAVVPWTTGVVRLSGRVLAEVGLQAPSLGPDQLVLVRAVAQ